MKLTIPFFFFLCFTGVLLGQSIQLSYYLPDEKYDPAIPSPESFLGFQIGEWHLSHDQQVHYLRHLAAASDRIHLEEYARTYEERPLLLLTITAPGNHQQLESIRLQHLALTEPDNLPVVVYQGFSIHGNEPSGGNAAVLLAYHLAASQDPEVTALLEEAVILLDPCFNPDGFNRFASWVNSHKSRNLVSDPQNRELNEAWPGGRTNHYWFDLNRDWLLAQHPESQGRLRIFHRWKPNVLTDHHEMGTNSTFFFQPGVPQRTHPLTPAKNQELTAAIGKFHAKALDAIGSLYYSEEDFDDFYYGKGSTYPDINGGIGILFEQASSRGHLQDSEHGPLSFPFTIRNQLTTALSTLAAAKALRPDLLRFQQEFFTAARQASKNDPVQAYVFQSKNDPGSLAAFTDLLQLHQIEFYPLSRNQTFNGRTYYADQAYVLPMQQTQYRLIKTIFETATSFQDSLFYDVSAWTIPLAYNLDYAALNSGSFRPDLQGDKRPAMENPLTRSTYAYAFAWNDYDAPRVLYQLQAAGLRTKVATQAFTTDDNITFQPGTIVIPVGTQELNPDQIYAVLQRAVGDSGVRIHPIETGLTPTGIDLGSRSLKSLTMPKVMLLVGEGVTSYDAGEVWHLLDQRYQMPVSMLEVNNISGSDLDRYNVMIMVNGNYSQLGLEGTKKIRDWVMSGGTLLTIRGAAEWAEKEGIAHTRTKKAKEAGAVRQPYFQAAGSAGAQVIGGAIFATELDLSHPIGYGISDKDLPVFRRGTTFFELPRNPYASPLVYTDSPLLSGYISKENLEKMRGSAAIVLSAQGKGRVLSIADNLQFRAYWYGTQKLTANALFFGDLVDGRTLERPAPKEEK